MTDDALALLVEHVLHDDEDAGVCMKLGGSEPCPHGWTMPEDAYEDGFGEERAHLAHVAQVLAEWVAGEKARAWDEGYSHCFDESVDEDDDPVRSLNDNPYRKDQERPAVADPLEHDQAAVDAITAELVACTLGVRQRPELRVDFRTVLARLTVDASRFIQAMNAAAHAAASLRRDQGRIRPEDTRP